MSEKNLTTDDKKPTLGKKESHDKKTTQANKTNRPGPAWLLLVLVLIIAVVGYSVYTTFDKKLNYLSDIGEQNQQSSRNALSLQKSTTDTLKATIERLTIDHLSVKVALSEKVSVLQQQIKKSKRQWLISEAEYLASIANTQLYLASNVATALSALQAADQRLKENAEPITYPIREQIALEISLLKRVELADIVGLSTQLLALESSVSHMNITAPHAGKAQASAIGRGEASAVADNVQQTLDDAWANFSKLIVIRHNDKPMAALMTPEQVELIRKNLALKIEAARLALIQKNESLYRANLNITADWLVNYFDPTNPAVKTAIKQIEHLKNTPIKVSLPDISRSLNMLRELPLTPLEQTTSALNTAKPTDQPIKLIKKSTPPANKTTSTGTQPTNPASPSNTAVEPKIDAPNSTQQEVVQ